MADKDDKKRKPLFEKPDTASYAERYPANPDDDLLTGKSGLMSSRLADSIRNFGKTDAAKPLVKDDLSAVGQTGVANPGPGPTDRIAAAADALGIHATELTKALGSIPGAIKKISQDMAARGAPRGQDPTSPDVLPGTRTAPDYPTSDPDALPVSTGRDALPTPQPSSLPVSTDRDAVAPVAAPPSGGMMSPPPESTTSQASPSLVGSAAAATLNTPSPLPSVNTPSPLPSVNTPSPAPAQAKPDSPSIPQGSPPVGQASGGLGGSPPNDPSAPASPAASSTPSAPDSSKAVPVPGVKPAAPQPAKPTDMGTALFNSDRSGQGGDLAGAQSPQEATSTMLKMMASPSVGGGPVEAFRVNGMNFKYVGVSDQAPSGYVLDKGGA